MAGDTRTLLLPVDDAPGDDVDLGVEDDDDDQGEVERDHSGVNLGDDNVSKKSGMKAIFLLSGYLIYRRIGYVTHRVLISCPRDIHFRL